MFLSGTLYIVNVSLCIRPRSIVKIVCLSFRCCRNIWSPLIQDTNPDFERSWCSLFESNCEWLEWFLSEWSHCPFCGESIIHRLHTEDIIECVFLSVPWSYRNLLCMSPTISSSDFICKDTRAFSIDLLLLGRWHQRVSKSELKFDIAATTQPQINKVSSLDVWTCDDYP